MASTKQALHVALKMGGAVNVLDQIPVLGYNPRVELAWSTSAPYTLTIHEYFNNIHLKQVFYLDDYRGNVTSWDPQEQVI